jgi:transcriptional regulator GlxA family with amidase domain
MLEPALGRPRGAGPGKPVEEVARRSGFGTATPLRTHLGRVLGTTPTAYRSSFART